MFSECPAENNLPARFVSRGRGNRAARSTLVLYTAGQDCGTESSTGMAQMASEARVKTVVLNHRVHGPSPPNGLAYPVTTFIDGVRQGFRGEVIVGEDLMVL